MEALLGAGIGFACCCMPVGIVFAAAWYGAYQRHKVEQMEYAKAVEWENEAKKGG